VPPLPACYNKNTSSTYLHGEAVVDTVATWVKNGFAAGPFDAPPLPGFRTNCLMAVDQGLKIRPILNVSSPEGESFNDNVDEFLCEKVQMATARNVSYMIMTAGKNCLLYKTDIKDAYKIVPAKIEDLRLQGFADVPAVSPANSSWGERFSCTYKRICRELNIQLAEDCAEFSKAFTRSTYGKILGK
jgi:hypothetical protein